jgi:hypothetical protein
MATKKETEVLEPTVEALQLFKDEQQLEADSVLREARYAALETAITFAKNNGGMHNAASVLRDAHTFLEFLKGETQ